MAKIAFFINDFNLGGTEKSLLNHISNISDTEIIVYAFNLNGDLLKYLPQNIETRQIFLKYDILKNSLISCFFSLIYDFKFKEAFLFFFRLIFNQKELIYRDSIGKNNFDERFDYAVAYAGPHTLITYIVTSKLQSAFRIQWIHFDLDKFYHEKNINLKLYHNIDLFCCVSDSVKEIFTKKYSEILNKKKVIVKYNTINEYELILLSKKYLVNSYPDKTIFLTVARLSKEKGLADFVNVISKIKERIPNLKWIIIGEGPEEIELRKNIKFYNLEDTIELRGKLVNPYPYFLTAHFFLQPSRYEGFSLSILEAKFFNLPIICTKFSGISEQLKNYSNPFLIFDYNYLYRDKLISDFVINNRRKVENNSEPISILKRISFEKYIGFEN